MPIGRVICDKRPVQVCESDPTQDMGIPGDIIRVVEADELGMKHRHVNQQGHEGEPQTNERRLPQPLHVEFPQGGVFRHGRVNPNGAYFLSRGFPVYCRERYIMENESTRINTNHENNKNHGLSGRRGDTDSFVGERG